MRKTFKYCPHCKDLLDFKKVEGEKRLACCACGWVHYENPFPCSAAFVRNREGGLLLVQRATEPGMGKWGLPSGFIEIDETPEEACLRELKEETGLTGKIVCLMGVYSQKSVFYKNVIIIGYRVKAIGSLSPGSDCIRAEYFSPNKLPEVAFPSHRGIIMDGIEIRES